MMSRRPRIITEILRNFKKSILIMRQKEQFVGEDQFGNKYYEKVVDPDKGLKAQRRVETTDPDKWNVPELPAEWTSWLQNRRKDPPTQEELLHNEIMRLKTKQRAIELEQSRKTVDKASDQERNIQEQITAKHVKFPVYEDYESSAGTPAKKPNKDDGMK